MKSLRKPTKFEERVYSATLRIPSGRVTTYAQLAKEIGCRSPRAVGQALKRNPYAPEVPCHRVVRSDGSLGGYQGKEGNRKKKRLLRQEGVRFKSDSQICLSSLYHFRR
jgi:methylated-DNA-[protein]-cysteine S-methyltransferase